MKLKINFVSKISKLAKANELVFVKNKNIKNKGLKPILKLILNNQLFKEQLFLQKEYKDRDYIFINCSNSIIIFGL